MYSIIWFIAKMYEEGYMVKSVMIFILTVKRGNILLFYRHVLHDVTGGAACCNCK